MEFQQRQDLGTEARAILEGALLGQSPAMQLLREEVVLASHAEDNTLLLGESGTGKEVVAQCIHRINGYAALPYLTVNVPAIPTSLIESELFGHRKASFTGADENREGVFQAAHGGILLLDEIGDMPLGVQAKLLRVLESGEAKRIGDNHAKVVTVRVLASTNHDLMAEVRAEKFRLDLYYRLAVLIITLPPLRDRMEDIPLLADHFLQQQSKHRGRSFTAAAINALLAHNYPGNVRELKNVVRRAAARSTDLCIGPEAIRIEREPAPDALAGALPPYLDPGLTLPQQLDEFLRVQIIAAFSVQPRPSVAKMAAKLGVAPKTLYNWIHKLELLEEVGVQPQRKGSGQPE